MTGEQQRRVVSQARRVVIKVGSRALASHDQLIDDVTSQVAELQDGGRQVLLVSSGAVAFGWKELGYKARPRDIPRLQASAAAGQSLLMERYSAVLRKHGRAAGQMLLTHADLTDRLRLNNARETLAALLDAGALPIINENDTVATDEIRVGDNDQLAAMVVPLAGADLLILLTDVEGVLDAAGERIPMMTADAAIAKIRSQSTDGTGGMSSKIDAAHKAAHSGASVVIARASEPSVVTRVLAGEDVGTLFPPADSALKARKHWIAYTLRPKGNIFVDAGAEEALRGGRSLLPIGVSAVSGQFNAGDAVRLIGPHGREFGRGLTRLGLLEVSRTAGRNGKELSESLSHLGAQPIVVHRDDLVISG